MKIWKWIMWWICFIITRYSSIAMLIQIEMKRNIHDRDNIYVIQSNICHYSFQANMFWHDLYTCCIILFVLLRNIFEFTICIMMSNLFRSLYVTIILCICSLWPFPVHIGSFQLCLLAIWCPKYTNRPPLWCGHKLPVADLSLRGEHIRILCYVYIPSVNTISLKTCKKCGLTHINSHINMNVEDKKMQYPNIYQWILHAQEVLIYLDYLIDTLTHTDVQLNK